MRHPARWIALVAGAVVALLAVVLALQVGADPNKDANRSHLVGKDAPSFDLVTTDGQSLKSSQLAGKVVIVNFWNSWCTPCQQEEEALKEFYARHAGEPDFAMVGIVRSDTDSAARTYAQEQHLGWTIAFDPGTKAALDFGTRGQPETYAITPDGVVAGSNFGPSTVGVLESMLAAARGRS